ncbi:MAG: 3-keto-5-aminohexanoate cleavage protein [Deltaproteobacteria bacterium]|nr:3-keto-5-aminohexanoate cleavage protein [Deltaproteobacteria bacterium]
MVLTAAIVGAEVTREQTPYVPITAEEIGIEAAKCREAGASIVHVHVRRPDGSPSQATELFDAAIAEIRKRTDIIVQVSTGGAVGMTAEERTGPLKLTGKTKPDMATLSTGTVNFGNDVFQNPRPLIREIATRIKALGIPPEIECFDVGMIDEAFALQKEGYITFPCHFDFVLGVPGSVGARPEVLELMRKSIPEGATWTVAGVGRFQIPMAELAAELGGNARVGLEDNIYLSKGVLAKGSFELVAEAAKRAKAKGREIATPEQTRTLLRVPRVVS